MCVNSLVNNKMRPNVPTIFDVIRLFKFYQSGGHETVSQWSKICNSLSLNEVEHLFIC